ncbi:MAG: hypothetical protein SNG35_01645 [Rikenellaceae bacterium]
MIVEQCITNYLTANRRLTLPGLGTFIVKRVESPDLSPSHELLFSEFLRDDDGVLRRVLCDGGLSEIEAAGAIDRLLFEIRHATNQIGGEYLLEGLGRLFRDGSGVLLFDANEDLVVVNEPVAEVTSVVEQSEPLPPVTPVVDRVNEIFTHLDEEQSEREQSDVLFSDEDRRVSKRVTQSGRSVVNTLWLVVPICILLVVVGVIWYITPDQWVDMVVSDVKELLVKIVRLLRGLWS